MNGLDPRRVAFNALWLVTGAVVVAYAAGMVEYGVALWNGRYPLALDVMAWFLPPDMVYGRNGYPHFMADVYVVFERNLVAMTVHILAGSVVLGLGLSQFIPAIRRQWPRVHRGLGMVVLLAMFATVAGATTRLLAEPAAETYSGPGFDVVLWYLAIATFVAVGQAVLALLQRDYRGHMIWMAIAWSAFLTAPSLRVSAVMLHSWYGGLHEHLNFSGGAFSWVQTSLLMVVWLQFVGDRDLAARGPTASSWPKGLGWALATATAVFALHEGVLTPFGLDALAGLRGELSLPPSAVLWGLASAAAAFGSVGALEASVRGRRPHGAYLSVVLASTVGALVIAATLPAEGQLAQPANASFLSMGIASLVLTAGAVWGQPNSLGRHVWGILLAFFTWSPSAVFLLWALGLFLGLTADEVYATGLVMGPTLMMTAGTAAAFGVQLRIPGYARFTHLRRSDPPSPEPLLGLHP